MATPTYEQKRDLFQSHFLLGKLEPGEIDTLATRARVKSYRAGQEIFARGSPERTMIAVLEGSVKIVSLSPTGKEVVRNVIQAGEVFGEISGHRWRRAQRRRQSEAQARQIDHKGSTAGLQIAKK